MIISRERYENYITPLIQGQANIKLSTRPKGGDLIWFPLDDRLYEIKDIEYAKSVGANVQQVGYVNPDTGEIEWK